SERGDTRLEVLGGNLHLLRNPVPDVLLAKTRDGEAELPGRPRDRVAEMFAVGGVDLRVRLQSVLERAEGLPGGE
ncbi:MAG TPA: hypothetical protein VF958_06055, partial [Thermoanaerobaculia bacterium]